MAPFLCVNVLLIKQYKDTKYTRPTIRLSQTVREGRIYSPIYCFPA